MQIAFYIPNLPRSFYGCDVALTLYGDDREVEVARAAAPWSFFVDCGDSMPLRYYPLCESREYAYATQEEAQQAGNQFAAGVMSSNYMAFLVSKNADFTEGRGPMVPQKLFRSYERAHMYIMEQKGIYGSSQYYQVTFGLDVKGQFYCLTHYNGYDIKRMELL